MNKTVTININGLIFNIDDEAYAQLRKYLETIKGYFKNAEGGEDIMTDIEARIAEMFQEHISDRKEVISVADVERMISVMGQPEDYIDEDMHQDSENGARSANSSYTVENEESGNKRFFRDPDARIIGGVCSGIGHYFGIDPVIIRVLFVLAFIFGFFGLGIYLILWIITPKAITTADKLQMKGKKVTVDTIRKSVEYEAEDIKKKFKTISSEGKLPFDHTQKTKVRNGLQSLFAFIGNILQLILKSLGKILGLFLFFFAGFWLLILIASFLGFHNMDGGIFFNNSAFSFTIDELNNLLFTSSSSKYLILIGFFFFLGIPLLGLFFGGLKLLLNFKTNFKGIGFGVFILWVMGLIMLMIGGFSVAKEFKHDESIKQTIALSPTFADTLIIDVSSQFLPIGEDPSKDKTENFILKRNETQLFIADVNLNVVENNTDSIVISIIQRSKGGSYNDASSRAERIDYHYSIEWNRLIFDPYYKLDIKDQYRLQEVDIQIAIPQGKTVFLSNNVGWVIDDIKNVNRTWDFDMLGKYWTMTSNGLECYSCPKSKNRSYDISGPQDFIELEIDQLNNEIERVVLDFDVRKSKLENESNRLILKYKGKLESRGLSNSKARQYELKIKELEVELTQKMKRLELQLENELRELKFEREKLERQIQDAEETEKEEQDNLDDESSNSKTTFKTVSIPSIEFPNPFALLSV